MCLREFILHECKYPQEVKGVGSSGVGDTSGCELPSVGSGSSGRATVACNCYLSGP